MISIIENNRNAITDICIKHSVLELYIFGSATTGSYNPDTSDIDFAVIYDPKIPVEDMADHFFGLIEELEDLLKNKIDLVTLKSIKNRIFREELERTMISLYAA